MKINETGALFCNKFYQKKKDAVIQVLDFLFKNLYLYLTRSNKICFSKENRRSMDFFTVQLNIITSNGMLTLTPSDWFYYYQGQRQKVC